MTRYQQFDQFLTGYTVALFWSSIDDHNGETVNIDDYMTSTQADDHCRAACRAFFDTHYADLELAAAAYSADDLELGWQLAGNDFALTRNRHGAGYWDGDLPEELGARLTEAAHRAGECWPYLGDDGLIYIQ